MKVQFFLLSLMLFIGVYGQPVVKINFLAEDMSRGTYDMSLGIDPSATDGLDRDLGEAELPPLPPSGVFDARFIFPDGLTSSLHDYRTGDGNFVGTHVHEISWQLGTGSPGLSLSWNLPDGVTMNITDPFGGVLINYDYGSGVNQLFVSGSSLNKLIVTLNYDHVSSLFSHEPPDDIRLMPNYPNPFNGVTNIPYFLNAETFVKLAIYDTLGSRIAILEEGTQSAGEYTKQFNPANYGISSGVYYYVMEAMNENGKQVFRESRKIMYMK